MSRSSQAVALSLRERTEIDAVFSRVRRGGHYELLGLASDADDLMITEEASRLRRWLDGLLDPDRMLGDYQPKVEGIAAAVQTAERVLHNPRERLRYDEARPRPSPSEPPQRSAEAAAKVGASPRVRSQPPKPQPGPESQVRYLLAVLEAQLSVALGRPAGLLDRVAELGLDNDGAPAVAEAESAEHDDRWTDAAVWWHIAGLSQPRNPKIMLNAASALRRAGAVTAYGAYASVATGDAWFDPDEQ